MVKLVTTAKTPEIAIAWPTRPSDIFRSNAIGVNKLTGINSDAIKTAQHKDITSTELHDDTMDVFTSLDSTFKTDITKPCLATAKRLIQ
jgi:hypothetical protein